MCANPVGGGDGVSVLHVLGCIGGLIALAVASDHFVAGSSAIARRWGVPALVVGVVVIGFGTSAPELLVSGSAALSGAPGVGVGNVVGSNIANLSLVLGAAAMVRPIAVGSVVLRRQMPLSLVASAAFGIAVQDGLTRVEGVVLAVLLVAGLFLMLRWARQTSGSEELVEEVEEYVEDESVGRRPSVEVVRTLLGLAGTLAGAQLLVWGAIGVAEGAGLSQDVIGMTVVALGTSLPELVTAIQAARIGETDLVIGNLLGSNLFNALAVGGLVALVRPGTVGGPELVHLGVGVMLGVTITAMVLMRRGQHVNRIDGAILVITYVVTLFLVA
jgi:cation:H+ antiporter